MRRLVGGCRLGAALAWVALVCAAPAGGQELSERLERLLHPQCLTPEAGRVLQELSDDGTLAAAAAPFAVAGGAVAPHRIELSVRTGEPGDAAVYSVTLFLSGWQSGEVDGRGQRFVFRLSRDPNAPPEDAARALIGLAGAVDRALPDTALAACAGADAPRAEQRHSLRSSLLSAALQLAALVAAILYGLDSLRARSDG